MDKTTKKLWGMYVALLAVFGLALVIIPRENKFVFWLALFSMVLMFVLCGVFGALRLKREKKQGLLPAWPAEFTVLVVQTLFFVFLHMSALFCPNYVAVIAEIIVYCSFIAVVAGEENLREAVRWLYARRRAVTAVCVAAVLAAAALVTGIPFVRYQLAEKALEKGEYESAAATFADMGDYMEAETLRMEALYRMSRAHTEAGEYEEAYFVLCDILTYADVAEYIEANQDLLDVRAKYAAFEEGNTVTFGTQNGEPLEWYVMDQQGSARLLYAVEPVAQMAYNTEFDVMSWEICSLRAWLNGDFMQAFDAREQKMILETAVENNDNALFRVEAGEDTVDRVYLLSIDEAEEYRKEYRGWFMGYTAWLRSPGCSRIDAALMTDGGGLYEEGANIHHDQYGVRPVMWIDITK